MGVPLILVCLHSSDQVLGALASAVTAPEAFYELGRGTTVVTFSLHQTPPYSSDCSQPGILSKREHKRGCVSVGCIFRQTNHTSNILKETTPRQVSGVEVGVETLNSSSKDSPLLGLALSFNQDL